jgi:hypothetical protein
LKLLVLNLLAIAAVDETRYCAFSRTRNFYAAKSRYNPLGVSSAIIEVVDRLASAGFIEEHRGFLDRETGIGRLSRIRGTSKLLEMVLFEPEELPPLLTCAADTECILLRPPKKDGKQQKPIEYRDTHETLRMRGVLSAYNELLQRTDITLALDPADAKLLGHDPNEWALNPASKRVYRIFNDGRWDHGGRFFGGWWESASKDMRAKILINGQPTIEIDYEAMHIKILYGLEGIDYDREIGGDPYELQGWGDPIRLRKVLKLAILIAVNAKNFDSTVRALRGKLSADKETFGWVFAEKIPLDALLLAMVDKHYRIAHLLFNERGKCLQFIDSQITERLLSWGLEQGIAILPVHDSYIIEQSKEEELLLKMNEAFRGVVDKMVYVNQDISVSKVSSFKKFDDIECLLPM